MLGAQLIWLGGGNAAVPAGGNAVISSDVSYWLVSAVIVAGWAWMLSLFDTRDYRILGSGFEEYRGVFNASLMLAGIVSIFAYLSAFELARGYVLIAFPVGTLALILSRWIGRQWLVRQRKGGNLQARVLLVGSRYSVLDLNRDLSRRDAAGYNVVGACLIDGKSGELDLNAPDFLPGTEVPIGGNPEDLAGSLDAIGADTVVIAGNDVTSTQWLREVGWDLDPDRHFLIVAPGLLDVGGPRIVTRPVAGLPLLHVDSPKFTRMGLLLKRAFDVLVSGLLILVLSPILIGTAIAVAVTSPGGVFFKQERVGYGGSRFTMWKFRSMRADAEEVLKKLQSERRDAGNDILFKMKDDPRITKVGKFIRRYSIDELPQLFNVFGGSMSLVGPRPPLDREVKQYEDHVHRRFMVKPGITGLWQVSGRSNLTWEETVRLDLYYVENWSMAGDLVILFRTARAVVASEGAY
ncbi:sugar transferase [Pseudoclavibacter helvolus]